MVSSERCEREKNQHFQSLKMDKLTCHSQSQNHEILWLFYDSLIIKNFPDHFAKFPDFSPTLKNFLIPLTFTGCSQQALVISILC